MSCRLPAHQHIHFSQPAYCNIVPQHNGNTCSNKKGSFTPCFHSKLLFDCCNSAVKASKTFTTHSNSWMSPLTAALTCKTAWASAFWKYYRIRSVNVSEWEKTFRCFLQEAFKKELQRSGQLWNEDVEWHPSDIYWSSTCNKLKKLQMFVRDKFSKTFFFPPTNWIIFVALPEQYAGSEYLQLCTC